VDVDPGRIRVVVGEDQPIVREGIVRVLQDSGFDVVGTAGDARDLIRKVRTYRPDIVVTDIQMPPDRTDDGLRAALEIRTTQPDVGVLVLSQFLEDRYAFDLVADGVQGVGYLLKEKVGECTSSPMPCAGWPAAGRRSTPTWWRVSSAVPGATARSTC
jgi:DNA-binding NarL/FixJ family response regulator